MDIEVKILDRIPDSNLSDFYETYRSGFAQLDSSGHAIERQLLYSEDEFLDIARDEDYIKCCAFDGEKLIALIIGTNKLEKIAGISYVNPRFIEKRFPEEVDEGRLFYCSPISVIPEYQHQGGVSLLLLQRVSEVFENGENHKVLFDMCEANRFLTRAVKRVYESLGFNVELEEVDRQTYFLASLSREA